MKWVDLLTEALVASSASATLADRLQSQSVYSSAGMNSTAAAIEAKTDEALGRGWLRILDQHGQFVGGGESMKGPNAAGGSAVRSRGGKKSHF